MASAIVLHRTTLPHRTTWFQSLLHTLSESVTHQPWTDSSGQPPHKEWSLLCPTKTWPIQWERILLCSQQSVLASKTTLVTSMRGSFLRTGWRNMTNSEAFPILKIIITFPATAMEAQRSRNLVQVKVRAHQIKSFSKTTWVTRTSRRIVRTSSMRTASSSIWPTASASSAAARFLTQWCSAELII